MQFTDDAAVCPCGRVQVRHTGRCVYPFCMRRLADLCGLGKMRAINVENLCFPTQNRTFFQVAFRVDSGVRFWSRTLQWTGTTQWLLFVTGHYLCKMHFWQENHDLWYRYGFFMPILVLPSCDVPWHTSSTTVPRCCLVAAHQFGTRDVVPIDCVYGARPTCAVSVTC